MHGTEVSVLGFARTLAAMGKTVLLVGPVEAGGGAIRAECERHGIPIVQIPSVRTWFFGQPDYRLATPAPLALLISDATDYVFINAFPGPLGLLAVLLGKLKKRKLIFYYHVYLPKFTECIPVVGRTRFVKCAVRFVTRTFSNMCDLVIAPSRFVRDEMLDWGIRQSKIRMLPTGIDPFFASPPEHAEVERVKHEYSSPLILYVGRLSQEKNIQLLLHAFDKILEAHPSATLTIVGAGPVERNLRHLARELQLERSVRFVGFMNWQQLKPLYWAADVFCMPSVGESQGLSIQEAKACGRACVVLAEAGAAEQIENGVDGLLVNQNQNVEATAREVACAVDRILSDSQLATQLGQEARRRALQTTTKQSTAKLLHLFSELDRPLVMAPLRARRRLLSECSSFLSASLRYLVQVYCRKSRAVASPNGLKADLHAHPYITNTRTLMHTLDTMCRNNVSLLAITVHGTTNAREMDYWAVRDMILSEFKRPAVMDMGGVLRVSYRGSELYLVPAYEDYCVLDGVEGQLDLVVLCPERSFSFQECKERDFDDRVAFARQHKGIVIAAHPYTIWDPHGPGGFIKFRLATPTERRVIRAKVFPNVDSVDLVATNCAWMMKSNELLRREYPGTAVCSSDTHAVNRWVRREVGSSGCVLAPTLTRARDESTFRDCLRSQISLGEFKSYLSYLGPVKFFISIALSRPTANYP